MKNIAEAYKDRISNIFAEGFESELLNASLTNLDVDNPLRFNNFAYSLRELLRHVLHRLSPDIEVSECLWFKPNSSSSTGFTRKHRIKYAIQGGLSDDYVYKKLGLDEIDDIIKNLLEIINLLSGYTHIESNTFNISDADTENLAIECLEAMLSFVEKMTETRKRVFKILLDDIDNSLVDRVISETVYDIMELSTHQSIKNIYSDGGYIEKIGSNSLSINISGNLECELQFGSSSDVRRGDGETIPKSFPFTGKIIVQFQSPLGSEIEVKDFNVDTSSWYE